MEDVNLTRKNKFVIFRLCEIVSSYISGDTIKIKVSENIRMKHVVNFGTSFSDIDLIP